MASALGVGLAAISKEVRSGQFPPGWYFVVRDLCDDVGIECPRALFKFKVPSGGPGLSPGVSEGSLPANQRGDAARSIQGDAHKIASGDVA